jgi:hypothetical protein
LAKVAIDKAGQFEFDLDILIKTRMLIQANSGGGKSFDIRRLAEQLFGKVQVVIIDTEGEFSSLREKYGFVLVGKDGETPADIRTAALVAEKLLELHASAVCDLYDMRPLERHTWVKRFIGALMNAPKELWHPVVIIVDEAHKLCPERGKGESEAKEEMLMLATAGRKRGYCAVFATQRLGKLDKDAAAELLNVMVGRTFLDIDRDRAADVLGINKSGKAEFDAAIRALEPGQFYVMGPAISTVPVLAKVGPVATTHPEVGEGMKAARVTPTPDQVKALLPKLADLPKIAQEKAQTIADLQKEVRSLRAQLAAKPRPEVVVDTTLVDRAVKQAIQPWQKQMALTRETAFKVEKALAQASTLLGGIRVLIDPAMPEDKIDLRRPIQVVAARNIASSGSRRISSSPESNGVCTGPEQRILNALAWMESIGNMTPKQSAVAFLAGYTVGGGAWNNPRGALRVRGLIDYRGDCLALTDAGRELAHTPDEPLTQEELHERVLAQLPGPEQKLLKNLLEVYPESMSNEELAQASNYALGGGAYNNPRGRLRTLGLIDYPGQGMVRAAELLFFD